KSFEVPKDGFNDLPAPPEAFVGGCLGGFRLHRGQQGLSDALAARGVNQRSHLGGQGRGTPGREALASHPLFRCCNELQQFVPALQWCAEVLPPAVSRSELRCPLRLLPRLARLREGG